jgi:hypothetical protein
VVQNLPSPGVGFTTDGLRTVPLASYPGGMCNNTSVEETISGKYPIARYLYRAPRKIGTSADLCESELWQRDSRVGTMGQFRFFDGTGGLRRLPIRNITMTSIGLRAVLFLSLTGVNTAASISARKVSNCTTRAMAANLVAITQTARSRKRQRFVS